MERAVKPSNTRKKTVNLWKIAFLIFAISPSIIHLAIFWLGTNVKGLVMSFQSRDGIWTFENYVKGVSMFFDNDTTLGDGLKNTTLFYVEGFCQMILAIFVSYLLYKKMFGTPVIRTLLYLPSAVSAYMTAMLFQQILVSNGPLVSFMMDTLGWELPTPLMIEEAMKMMIIYDVWISVGGGLMVWFGAMSRIPTEVIEYGKLDGIGPFKEFTTVILPMIWPTFVTMVTLGLVGFFGSSGPILLFTEGKYGTTTISYWLFSVVYTGNTKMYNIAMAVGWTLTFITLPMVLLARWICNRFGQEVEY